MTRGSLAMVGVTIGVCALTGSFSVHMAAQGGSSRSNSNSKSNSSAASKATTLKTPWGHPDLQGVWTTDNEVGIPLERPVDLGEKATLLPEEARKRAAAMKAKYQDNKEDRGGELGNGQAAVHWYEGANSTSNRTSLIINPLNGRLPALTPDAVKRVVRKGTAVGFVGGSFGPGPYDVAEDLALTDRCITRGLPNTWFPSEYNNGFQIVQSADTVSVWYERLHEPRVIYLDGRPHLPNQMKQWFGDSRGHWEGDTLVVDVTNFSAQTDFRKSTTGLHLTERYTRVGAEEIRVEITVDDPTTWTQPWTFFVTGKKDPAYWQIFEYSCHEGNYGMRNMLSASRFQEKQKAAEAQPK